MLVILASHPIQYQVPIWQEIARRNEFPFEVWYLSQHAIQPTLDTGFGEVFSWDLDLVTGYPHSFLRRVPSGSDLPGLSRSAIAGLGRQLRERSVSAVLINGWGLPAYWQAAFAASRRGIDVWLRGESNDLRRRSGARGLLWEAALKTLFSRVTHFLYIGSANRRLYESFGVPANRLISAPYCVQNDRFAAAALALQSNREQLRRDLGVGLDDTVLLFAGKFIEKKRPLDLLSAVERVLELDADTGRRLRVLMVGQGPMRQQLTERADSLRRVTGRQSVIFSGFLNQQEMPKAYAAADWLVLPSDAGETWGLVVNEALASGLPVLASDRCGASEDLVAHQHPAFVFPCGNMDALARLLHLVGQGRLCKPTAQRCQEIVAGHDLGQTVDAVSSLYRERFG